MEKAKKTNLQRARGVRDFLPELKIARDNIIKKIVDIFELYGYSPLETPIIERYDLFASKFAQGEESEAMQESFTMTDRGDRKLILRNDFTVPFARLVGMNPTLKMPFKRYQIGQIFRDGPLKPGRYREFWQCDVDTVGLKSGAIDAEIIDLTSDVFEALGLEVNIQVNNRKILNSMLSQAGIDEDNKTSAIISIDKFDKIGASGVSDELKEKNIKGDSITKLLKILEIKGKDNDQTIVLLQKELDDKEGLEEMRQTLNYVTKKDNVIFLPSLARGLAYYTGSIFEAFLKDTSKINCSLAGGGRYDKMIPGFLNSKEDFPSMGISFGLETIFDALDLEQKTDKKTVTDIYIAPLGQKNLKAAVDLAQSLRQKNYRVDIDYSLRSPSKSLAYANGQGIKIVLLLGDDEIKNNTISAKNMESGQQKTIASDDLEKYLKSNL